MKALVAAAPGRLEMRELPLPHPGPGQLRIRTAACGVCVTDLAMIAGWQRTGFPGIPGHEWSGWIDAVGAGVAGDLVDRLCVAENVLSDGGEVGFEHPGGYAQYFLTEAANVHPLPESMPPVDAALIEPLAVCCHGMQRLGMLDKRSAVVFGDGPIGLIFLMLLVRAGVSHIALVGGRSSRLALAREFGAHEIMDYQANDLAARVGSKTLTCIEASGSTAAMANAIAIAEHGAKILVLGDYGAARADFPWNTILHRELTLTGSNASAGAWPEAVRLAASSELHLARLVTHRFPVTRFAEAVELVRSKAAGVVKLVLEWEL